MVIHLGTCDRRARYMRSPYANMGKPPRAVLVFQLKKRERSLSGGANCGIRKINEAKALRFQDSLAFFGYDRWKWLFSG